MSGSNDKVTTPAQERTAAAGSTSASSRAVGAETRRCSKCKAVAEDNDRNTCQQCGSFLPANTAALVHGGRRFVDGRSPMDEAERVAVRNAVLADLGGEDEISQVLRELVEGFAFAVVLRDLLAAHLAAVGPLTKRNRKRAALDAWHTASARVESLAAKIGLERRGAPVPSLDEFLRERAEEKSNGGADGR